MPKASRISEADEDGVTCNRREEAVCFFIEPFLGFAALAFEIFLLLEIFIELDLLILPLICSHPSHYFNLL